jgi:hypothetical protein
MAERNNKRVRRERYQRNLERDIQDHQDPPSGGQYTVFNRDTKEKTKGLNWAQAEALWRQIGNAMIFPEKNRGNY